MILNAPCNIETMKSDGGFTIIEVLVAIAIFSIGFLATGLMQINAMNRTNSARQTTEAMTLADDQAERLTRMPFYADDNGLNDDGAGGIDDFDVPPDLAAAAENAPHVLDADGPFTVRWTVTDDVPIPAYAEGVFTVGRTLTRSKTIRVWVTPDNNPNDIRTELMFSKFYKTDRG